MVTLLLDAGGPFVANRTELTTAVTDLLLAATALACVGRFRTEPPRGLSERLWTFAFLAIGGAALLGAGVHGLHLAPALYTLTWRSVNLLLGVGIATFLAAAATDGWGEAVGRRSVGAALLVAGIFFLGSWKEPDDFSGFLPFQAAAVCMALVVYSMLVWRGRRSAAFVVAGLVITMVAAAIQALSIRGPDLWGWPVDHNGLFHLVQMPGLYLLAVGITGLRENTPVRFSPPPQPQAEPPHPGERGP